MAVFFIKGMQVCRSRKLNKKDSYVCSDDLEQHNKNSLKLKRFLGTIFPGFTRKEDVKKGP